MNWIWMGIYHGLAMFWATLWALVLGFGISAALQVFVSKEQMNRAFGQTNLKTMLLATGLGAASSSCSYAAVAAGRSAFQRGAALIVALAFMFERVFETALYCLATSMVKVVKSLSQSTCCLFDFRKSVPRSSQRPGLFKRKLTRPPPSVF